ncbi:hypothetical protein B8V66_06465 [Streptococcus agalactiae]|nr:hypothetical protein B8V66_06465 [Streptococcus agalactiae]
MEKEAKQIIDLKRNLFKIDVRAQKDEEKVFMRTAWLAPLSTLFFTSFSVKIGMVKAPPKKQVFTILEFASRSPWTKFERGAFFISIILSYISL